MTAEEEFEKWWATELKGPHGFLDMRKANALYLAATKSTAARCVEICMNRSIGVTGERWDEAQRCAAAIKQEHGLE